MVAGIDLTGVPPQYHEEFRKIWESGETYKGKWNWTAFLFGTLWAVTKGLWASVAVSLSAMTASW